MRLYLLYILQAKLTGRMMVDFLLQNKHFQNGSITVDPSTKMAE